MLLLLLTTPQKTRTHPGWFISSYRRLTFICVFMVFFFVCVGVWQSGVLTENMVPELLKTSSSGAVEC